MNKDLNKIKGLLNYVGGSQDFFDEFEPLDRSRIFCDDKDPSNINYGMLCFFKHVKDKVVKVDLSLRSYLNIKYFADKHTEYVPNCHRLFNIFINFGKINIVAAFVPIYEGEHYCAYLLMENDGAYICTSCYLTDAIGIMQSVDFPIYFHSEIVYELGESIDNIKGGFNV